MDGATDIVSIQLLELCAALFSLNSSTSQIFWLCNLYCRKWVSARRDGMLKSLLLRDDRTTFWLQDDLLLPTRRSDFPCPSVSWLWQPCVLRQVFLYCNMRVNNLFSIRKIQPWVDTTGGHITSIFRPRSSSARSFVRSDVASLI